MGCELVQIYFDKTSLSNCYDSGVTKVFNSTLTPFFENEIILHYPLTEEYTGFLSHDFSRDILTRRGQRVSPKLIREVLTSESPEVLIMHSQKSVKAAPIWQADNWHLKQFSAPWERLMNELNIEPPKEGWMRWRSRYVCFSNYWVMKKELIEEYRQTLLAPAMEIMTSMKELWTDSGYKRSLNWKQHFGVNFCPLHPFICERLILIFIQDKQVSVL